MEFPISPFTIQVVVVYIRSFGYFLYAVLDFYLGAWAKMTQHKVCMYKMYMLFIYTRGLLIACQNVAHCSQLKSVINFHTDCISPQQKKLLFREPTYMTTSHNLFMNEIIIISINSHHHTYVTYEQRTIRRKKRVFTLIQTKSKIGNNTNSRYINGWVMGSISSFFVMMMILMIITNTSTIYLGESTHHHHITLSYSGT